MDEGLQARIGRNESIFREVNEAIKRGQWPGEVGSPVAFRCECGRLGCSRMIELSIDVYERVRSHPRCFLLADGHDISGAETVVETHPGYIVVEKRGEAGRLAVATDPRS